MAMTTTIALVAFALRDERVFMVSYSPFDFTPGRAVLMG
jgi:hypothetical protein